MAADEQQLPHHHMEAAGAPNGDEDRTPAQDAGRPPVSRRHVVRTGLAALSGAAAASIPGLASGGPRSGTSTDRGRLVLKERELAPKINKLFQKLARDAKARKAFVEDPCSILIREVLPPRYAKISKPRIANANRLLYSLQSNDGFRKWVNSYQRGLTRKNRVDKGKVMHDWAVAIAEYAAPPFFMAILLDATVKVEKPEVAIVIVASIVGLLDGNPVFMYQSIQDVSTKPPSAQITPAQMRAISQQLISHAKQLRKTGKLMRNIIIR